MRLAVTVCDRCGKKQEMEPNVVYAAFMGEQKEVAFIGKWFAPSLGMQGMQQGSAQWARVPADLCDACAASLKDWWSNGRGDAK